MSGHQLTVLVMAKAPVPGRVKTRLCPPLTETAAAGLAAAALLDTVDAVDTLASAPAGRVGKVIALDGSLVDAVDGPLIAVRITSAGRARWTRITQRGAGFADRLILAHTDAAGSGPVLQIGMDTPQLTADLMAEASATLFRGRVDAVVGPATDGGWWSLGLRNAQMARALLDVPMSTSATGELTVRALRADGLRVALLPSLTDVDIFSDAVEVAGAAPGTRFARAFRALSTGTAA
jgi:glycosyltransferase A (GT-A) superfamily protein (DUF2064 family)